MFFKTIIIIGLFSDGEGRHSREGSSCSNRGSQVSHSRQNSKDKTIQHSRQNSKELLDLSAQLSSLQNSPLDKSVKSIEIYATLPKNKKGLLSRSSNKSKQVIEDEKYIMYERPSRSLQTKSKTNKKEGEKRAKSEEHGTKNSKELFVSNSLSKETKKPKVEENKDNKQGKKQHKIRRKLLMGGLIKRKNRSMPDLREDELQLKDPPKEKIISKDDLMVDLISSQSNLSGYLSEGHLEISGNPNLLRSKLMRKSFYTNKFLHFAKVPPPPPMRTSSQLSKGENNTQKNDWCSEPQSLPYIHPRKEDVTYANGGMLLDKDNKNVLITQAQVHHSSEQNIVINNVDDLGLPLPPYPSPLNSVCHSRQHSEEFPPPPPSASQDVDEVDGICPVMSAEQVKLEVNKEENWVKELKSNQTMWCSNDQANQDLESKSVVKDLKNKFEQKSVIDNLITHAINNLPADGISETVNEEEKKIEKELKGALSKIPFDNNDSKRRSGKKKNVTFCEQVVLVATAEEDEVDSYIPNPILERVLRSVLHKDAPIEQNREVTKSVIPLKRNDSGQFNRGNLSIKQSYEKNNVEEKFKVEVKEELPPKTYRMSPVQQLPQTPHSPMVQPKLKAPLPDQIQKPAEPVKNYRMSPIQQSVSVNQSPLAQQKFKPSSSQISNQMSNLSLNSIDSNQLSPNQSLIAHRFYPNAQQTNVYPQQYQSLSSIGHQKPFMSNDHHSLNYQQMNENNKLNCSPVNSRSNQSSLERNQKTKPNGVLPNCYPQHSPVESRSGHFRYNDDSQTQPRSRLHGNQVSSTETNAHQYQPNPGSPRTLYTQSNNIRFNTSNMEQNGQYQNNENKTYNHGQTTQYPGQQAEKSNNSINNNNSGHLLDNRTCYPRQSSPIQVQHNNANNNNVCQQINSTAIDHRSTYVQSQQQFDRLNSSLSNNDKTTGVAQQQGSAVPHQFERSNNHHSSQYNHNSNNSCEVNKTSYLQQGVSANQAQQLERMAQHYENKMGGYIQQGLQSPNQSQQYNNTAMTGGDNSNKSTTNSPQGSVGSYGEPRTDFPAQCSPIPPVAVDNSNSRTSSGYPRNNAAVKADKFVPSPQHSPGLLQRQRSMVNGFHSMPYTRAGENVAHLPPAHPKKDSQPNFARPSPAGGDPHLSGSSSLDRKHLQQYNGAASNHQQQQQLLDGGSNPTLPSKNRGPAAAALQRTNTTTSAAVRRPMTVYEPPSQPLHQQLPPYQHPPVPVAFKQQQQQQQQARHNPGQLPNRSTTPNGSGAATTDPGRYAVYQQPPSPRLQEKNAMAATACRPSPCNLCRKKPVNHPSIYCSDCDFYMSRFKPKAQSTTC